MAFRRIWLSVDSVPRVNIPNGKPTGKPTHGASPHVCHAQLLVLDPFALINRSVGYLDFFSRPDFCSVLFNLSPKDLGSPANSLEILSPWNQDRAKPATLPDSYIRYIGLTHERINPYW